VGRDSEGQRQYRKEQGRATLRADMPVFVLVVWVGLSVLKGLTKGGQGEGQGKAGSSLLMTAPRAHLRSEIVPSLPAAAARRLHTAPVMPSSCPCALLRPAC